MNRKQQPPPPKIIAVDQKQLDELLEHAEAGQALSQEECQLLRAAFGSLAYLENLLSQKNISIARLRKLVFGVKTETTKAVLGEEADETAPPAGVGAGEEAGSPNAAPKAAPKPFDYLTELQRHAPQVAAHPQNWMPWNYRQTIDGVADTTPLETVR